MSCRAHCSRSSRCSWLLIIKVNDRCFLYVMWNVLSVYFRCELWFILYLDSLPDKALVIDCSQGRLICQALRLPSLSPFPAATSSGSKTHTWGFFYHSRTEQWRYLMAGGEYLASGKINEDIFTSVWYISTVGFMPDTVFTRQVALVILERGVLPHPI